MIKLLSRKPTALRLVNPSAADRKSGSAGMPRPNSYAVFCLKKKILSTSAFSQQPKIPGMPSPPPMRFVTRSERSELASAGAPNARLRETLTNAQGNLQRAEPFTADKKFDAAAAELVFF